MNNMKIKILAATALLIIVMAACKKDNYKPPTSVLKGRVVYQGQALGLRSNAVQLELWQSGYQLFTKIPVYVAHDGTFSASLFDGSYKLVRLKGNGPWADNIDSIAVNLNGSSDVDVNMDPYFVIKNETYTKAGTTVNVTFNLQRVNTTKALELVRIYVGQTVILDQNNNAANAQKLAAAVDVSQPVTLSVTIPASIASKDYVFMRVGVKTAGVAELLYSQAQKLSLK
jgi:hypothetical protein